MANDVVKPEAQHAGMPPLDASADGTSWFEFAPSHLFYTPIALYCGWLTLKHFGFTLPTNSNPSLPYSGLVGESKSMVLDTMQGADRALVAPYVRLKKCDSNCGSSVALKQAKSAMMENGLKYPLVAKPDIGMRGAGVQKIMSDHDLESYLRDFPGGAEFLLQELMDMEGEAGVFYVRYPHEEKGRIMSLTLKYFPRVLGDGQKTLRELIMADSRASKLSHLYLNRHKDQLDSIIPAGESVRLAFAGNHCRGTIFRNGTAEVTDAMTDAFDRIAKSMGEFYVGRFDVRFHSFSDLKAGEGFRIIEVNGAGGEATHIWDARMTLRGAYKTLMQQYSHLYAIGRANRKRGFKPTPLLDLIKAWRHEKKLTSGYPITH